MSQLISEILKDKLIKLKCSHLILSLLLLFLFLISELSKARFFQVHLKSSKQLRRILFKIKIYDPVVTRVVLRFILYIKFILSNFQTCQTITI